VKKLSFVRLILLLISIILLIGSQENKIKKANFFSSYVLFPYINSMNYFQSLKLKEVEIDELTQLLYKEKIYSSLLKTELIRFKSELDLKDRWFSESDSLFKSLDIISTKVISNSFPVYSKVLLLDKGKNFNVNLNDAVMSQYGIVGKIINVGPTYSLVLPIVNYNAKFSVMNKKNVQGILNADYQGTLKMSFIEKNSDIDTGDTLYTSNLSDIFTNYYAPVGVIDSVFMAENQLYLEAYVSSFTQINNLTTVFIIKRKKINEKI
jgi:rod shape-determining protein MreC